MIIDEFSELLGARPDLAELFVTVGRIGRSIGIHLLLSTQRLDAGRIRGLESHLSYRICLRTFSEAESPRRWAPRCHSRSSTVSARDRRNCIGG